MRSLRQPSAKPVSAQLGTPRQAKASLPGVLAKGAEPCAREDSAAQKAGEPKQQQTLALSPQQEREAQNLRRLSEAPVFGGTAASSSKPQTGLMARFGQPALLSQRIEEEKKANAGVGLHSTYADDIMPAETAPNTPSELKRLAAEQRELKTAAAAAPLEQRQPELAGVGSGSSGARHHGVITAEGGPRVGFRAEENAQGVHSRQEASALNGDDGSHGGFGGHSHDSRSSSAWDTPGRQADYSTRASSALGSSQVPPELLCQISEGLLLRSKCVSRKTRLAQASRCFGPLKFASACVFASVLSVAKKG